MPYAFTFFISVLSLPSLPNEIFTPLNLFSIPLGPLILFNWGEVYFIGVQFRAANPPQVGFHRGPHYAHSLRRLDPTKRRELGGVICDKVELLLRLSNSLCSRDGHEVFSAVPGGPRRARPSRRPLFFSRRISRGSRSPALPGGEYGVPLLRSGTLIRRRKEQAGSLGTEEKTS